MLTGLLIALLPTQDDIQMTVMAKGAMPVMGGYMPQRLPLIEKRPEGLSKAPQMENPAFGVINFGPKNDKTQFIVAMDGPQTLYVDSNANGDLTDDPKPEWSGSPSGDFTTHRGSFTVQLTTGSGTHAVSMGAYRFDPSDPARGAYTSMLLYYSDYAMTGQVTLGSETYKVMLADRQASGDFEDPACQIMIDRDADGKYDSRFEVFGIDEPFNIGGVTYELNTSGANSGSLATSVSTKSVKEKEAPPNLSVGRTVLSFEAVATDGSKIKFPESYKGKIVMLDFWATWCGPCIAELPNVTKAYESYHGQGFEILGISLDVADKAEHLADFTKKNGMPWKQIYEGKYWDVSLVKQYGVRGIPFVLLVDGDTGEILADARTLRGPMISKTIDAALAKKRGVDRDGLR